MQNGPFRMSPLGLGRVKTYCLAEQMSISVCGQGGEPQSFLGFDYALMAAMSGLVPMMFITRVRL